MHYQNHFTIGCVIGTRPELIKMAPVIFKLQQAGWAKVSIINTAQHRNLLDDMFELFNLSPDFDLDCMTKKQTLGDLTGTLFIKLEALVKQHRFDTLLAVGDTTTVFVSSLIAFYHGIPFGHIEAGMRTYNVHEPFPEEINRVLTTPLSTWHFAPTVQEKENLLREQIAESKIFVTGNPVIDSLYWVLANTSSPSFFQQWPRLIVVTAHRRENIGESMRSICQAIINLSNQFEDIHFVLPVHPNPNVQQDILSLLNKYDRIHLLEPLRYDEFAHLMAKATLVLTDSGGIQEEAPALSKPVIVLRNTTERPAVVNAGVGLLVGTDTEIIVSTVAHLLSDTKAFRNMAKGISPYGDGHAAERIVECLENDLMNS